MRMPMIDLSSLYDAPIDPATLQFKAIAAKIKAPKDQPEKACMSCLFKGQRNKVCVQAGQLARLSSMPDCEDIDPETGKTWIYQLRETDPRQISIMENK